MRRQPVLSRLTSARRGAVCGSTYGAALVFVCTFALAACRAPEPATEVLVQVSSDLTIGTELRELRLQVYNRNGKELSAERTIAIEPDAGVARAGPLITGRYWLPIRFSVYPQKGATDFRIVVGAGPVDASGEWKPIVERQAITSFLPRQQTFLPIFLAQTCKQVLCTELGQRSDKTCDQGRCTDVPFVLPQKEATFDAGPLPVPADAGNAAQPVTDAGNLPVDAGPVDAAPTPGADTAGDAGADASVDAGPVNGGPVDAAGDGGAADGGAAAGGAADGGAADGGVVDSGRPDLVASDAGPPDAGPVDAGPCGTWVTSGRDDAPPVGATTYGHEDTLDAPFSFEQYVCRAPPIAAPLELLPGKGVYPYGCLFPRLDNATQDHADYGFEVLSGTAGCAQMVPVEIYLANRPALIATGRDGTGNELYSCAARETSAAAGKPLARPLGRYDVATNDCIYEWATSTHKQSTHGAGTSFDVLVRR